MQFSPRGRAERWRGATFFSSPFPKAAAAAAAASASGTLINLTGCRISSSVREPRIFVGINSFAPNSPHSRHLLTNILSARFGIRAVYTTNRGTNSTGRALSLSLSLALDDVSFARPRNAKKNLRFPVGLVGMPDGFQARADGDLKTISDILKRILIGSVMC